MPDVHLKIQGLDGGIWYLPLEGDTPYHVPLSDSPNYEQGFGGDTVTIRLLGGRDERVRGPWVSNAVAVFEQTGFRMPSLPAAYDGARF